jgi:hypothetical protein
MTTSADFNWRRFELFEMCACDNFYYAKMEFPGRALKNDYQFEVSELLGPKPNHAFGTINLVQLISSEEERVPLCDACMLVLEKQQNNWRSFDKAREPQGQGRGN